MSPIKNIYMHFSSLPDPLKSPTLEIFQIFFFLFSYWDWKSAPKKKPKKPKSEVGIISIFWKGRFLIFLNYFWTFIAGFFFLSFFKIIFIFNLYKKVGCLFTGWGFILEMRWWEGRGGDFKKFSYQTAMDSCFWESGLIVSRAGVTPARGGPTAGGIPAGKIPGALEALGEALECGVWKKKSAFSFF